MPLTQGLHRHLQRQPHAAALLCQDRQRSWSEFADRVARLAGVLQSHGVQPGDRVALLGPNSDHAVEALLAVWWLGAAAVPLNTRWSGVECQQAVADCGARLLFADPAVALPASLQTLPTLPLGTAIDALIDAAPPLPDAGAGGDTLAAILYTGGTTGRAKGVMLSHANFWITAVARMAEYANPPQWRSLIVAPLFHVAGLGRLVAQLVTGAATVLLGGFRADALLDCIEHHGVSDVVLVPSMLQMALDHPAFDRSRLASLQRLIYGASPIAPALLARAMDALPHVAFMQAYGMTEAAATVASCGPEHHGPAGVASGRIRSVGRAGYCNLIRIVGSDGVELPRGQVGELVISGPNVMLGYWKQPDATARVLRGGWYHSGDGAWMDDAGYIFVVDRLKDMVVTGGENVYSAEVEAVLLLHPAVAACAVIGVPSAEWGEAVHAAVVLRPGADAGSDDLRRHCREHLAGYKCPKTVDLRAALPMSAAGKVLKSELRAPFWHGRERNVN